MLTYSLPNLGLCKQQLTRMGDGPPSRAAGCARLPAGVESQSCSEVIWKRDISPHLSRAIKCGVYFHLQQGLRHRCGQVPKVSVPHLRRKGRTAIRSCFCKALGARQLRASAECCHVRRCCRPRLWQSKQSRLSRAVPYAIYFCRPRAGDAAWGDGSRWQARIWMPKVQDPAEEMESFSYCGCTSPLAKEGRSWDWQAAKSIFSGDIITNNDLQPRQ